MKKRLYLLNGNRVVIYVLSLLGVFYEVNIAYIMALTLWLWLPQCLQLELLLLKAIARIDWYNINRLTQWTEDKFSEIIRFDGVRKDLPKKCIPKPQNRGAM